ncbi:phospholipid/cholesterol/gamma-HCH transport system permease protein [Desulfacinum hydrothermale DSM 13146]|uniref:Phospholipid/cholesterol/gamma-HCH transport system permease protein n=1 Tax=Desulfacinum hydrothermale DSM 13146 TaxID=1121390 RepID=A0A1W1X119_9BACT|nr:MlaE family lipid ABC transporter permease subunit [Desulfacinum hydrothermale]SMC17597.1 phospholipid/cholesterol/gamma-HCH transport system permease protein [Desulfacinum hydrothermale DSM 13146]
MEGLLLDVLSGLGRWTLGHVRGTGRAGIFLMHGVRGVFRKPKKFRAILGHVHFIGTKSFFVIGFTAAFTGMVLGLQGYYTLSKFGSEGLLGAAVALSLIRELGPVLSALMVTGRAGSAICAEIGIMRIEEQIDALECMAIDPHAYLIAPRFVASLVAMPLLTAFFDVVGIAGGYLVGVSLLGVNPGAYLDGMQKSVEWLDVYMGLVKSFIFAMLFIWICTYKGYFAGVDRGSFGPEDVGRATTDAVVVSSVAILVSDYVVTSLLL